MGVPFICGIQNQYHDDALFETKRENSTFEIGFLQSNALERDGRTKKWLYRKG